MRDSDSDRIKMTREKERAEKLTISGWKMSTALSR